MRSTAWASWPLWPRVFLTTSVFSHFLLKGFSLQFHRYNGMWTRDVQDVIFAILMCGWLGGLSMKDKPAQAGKLLTIEEVGEILNGKFQSLPVPG